MLKDNFQQPQKQQSEYNERPVEWIPIRGNLEGRQEKQYPCEIVRVRRELNDTNRIEPSKQRTGILAKVMSEFVVRQVLALTKRLKIG